MSATQSFFDPGWVENHLAEIAFRLGEHLKLTVIAIAIGLSISFPLALLCRRVRWLLPPVTWTAGLLYTIPSLALFALLVPITGLTTTTAEIGLVSYTLLILIRNCVAGLEGVPEDVKEAAAGMGLSKRQILWRVELPLALPVIFAGIRIATVTTIGLVTVTSLIGKGGLGYFILIGLRRFFTTPILVGAALSVALAVVTEWLLLIGQRFLSPWMPRGAR